MIGTQTDNAERRQAEEALREIEQKFSLIATGARDAIIILDSEARVSFWNRMAEQIFAYQAAEVMGKELADLIIPERYHAAYKQAYETFKRTGNGALIDKTTEMEARRKDGSVLHVELSISTATIRGKLCCVGILRDISERKQLEAKLRKIETELGKTTRVMNTLRACNEIMVRADSEGELIKDICHVITTTGSYKLAWVGYAEQNEKKEKTVRPVAQSGFNAGYLEQADIRWDESPRGRGPAGRAIRSGQHEVCQDIQNDPAFEPWRDAAVSHGFRSVIILPLKVEDKILGTMHIYAESTFAFIPEEISLLQNLADDMAYGIESLRAVAEKDKYASRLSASLIQAIESIALTVEKRDPYTSGHMRRVAKLSVAIARELGLPEQQIEGIALGASIHDIGKIYIPAEILNRPGKLTDAEFAMIKSHTQVGYDIIKGIDFPWPIAEMVYQHHERLDGSGYPNGLKGDDIAYEAQILSVADVVEAICSHRPYRPALGLDAGLDFIQKGRETLFNSEIVETCVRIIREHQFEFE